VSAASALGRAAGRLARRESSEYSVARAGSGIGQAREEAQAPIAEATEESAAAQKHKLQSSSGGNQ